MVSCTLKTIYLITIHTIYWFIYWRYANDVLPNQISLNNRICTILKIIFKHLTHTNLCRLLSCSLLLQKWKEPSQIKKTSDRLSANAIWCKHFSHACIEKMSLTMKGNPSRDITCICVLTTLTNLQLFIKLHTSMLHGLSVKRTN